MQPEEGAAEVSRREVALAGLAALSLAAVRPAQAGLLGGPSDNDIYSSDTVRAVLGPAAQAGASSITAAKATCSLNIANTMAAMQVAHACSLGRALPCLIHLWLALSCLVCCHLC